MDKIGDLDVNTATWRIFLNVTLQAAVHLGQVCADGSNRNYWSDHD